MKWLHISTHLVRNNLLRIICMVRQKGRRNLRRNLAVGQPAIFAGYYMISESIPSSFRKGYGIRRIQRK